MSRNQLAECREWHGAVHRGSGNRIRSVILADLRRRWPARGTDTSVGDDDERRFIVSALIWFVGIAVTPLILFHMVHLICPELLRTSIIPKNAGGAGMASTPQILIATEDHQRLQSLLNSELAVVFSDKPYLQSLRGKLETARPVASGKIPADIVTMHSIVRLREHRGRQSDIYTLVYPEEADIAAGKLSVLAPIGTAVLGRQVGDLVNWQVPHGTVRLHVEELLFQPERDGAMAT